MTVKYFKKLIFSTLARKCFHQNRHCGNVKIVFRNKNMRWMVITPPLLSTLFGKCLARLLKVYTYSVGYFKICIRLYEVTWIFFIFLDSLNIVVCILHIIVPQSVILNVFMGRPRTFPISVKTF